MRRIQNFQTCGRELIAVDSRYTTQICGTCGALTGPKGIHGLSVRQWDCVCGARLDRDINAAKNVLSAGLGISHEREERKHVAA